MNSTDFRSLANEVMAMVSHVEAQQRPAALRPAGYPARLDAAQPGDVLVLIDAGQTPATRRLVTVAGRDDRGIDVDGVLFHGGNGFHLAGLRAGNLVRFVQPLDDWSWPGWDGSLRLEV